MMGMKGMRWGVKSSFVSYVARMPDGAMSVTGGAASTDDGYVFPVRDATDFDARTGSGTLRFEGDLRFRAHAGMLQVRLADPEVETTGNGAWLTVLDAAGERIPLCHLGTPHPADGGGIEIPTALTVQGVPYFNDVYPEGTSLDPIVIRGV